MAGPAYRTPVEPDPPHPLNDEAIYAVYPPLRYAEGPVRETPHLLVSSSRKWGDTVVYPACESGAFAYIWLGCVPGMNHRRALRSLGYELEAVTHVPA